MESRPSQTFFTSFLCAVVCQNFVCSFSIVSPPSRLSHQLFCVVLWYYFEVFAHYFLKLPTYRIEEACSEVGHFGFRSYWTLPVARNVVPGV